MTLPSRYRWLLKEPGPKILVEALKTHGVIEVPGPGNNPDIMRWARFLDLGAVYTHDGIAWCGLGMAYWARMAGYAPPHNPLWARNWLKWGTFAKVPMLGDVMVFERGTGGHVALYVGEDASHWHIFGCNQSDQVNIVRKAKNAPRGSRLIAARRSPFRIGQPANIRVVRLAATGPVSTREA